MTTSLEEVYSQNTDRRSCTMGNMLDLKFVFVFGVLSLCFCSVIADNSTTAYREVRYQNGPKHQPRFLSFHSDEGDLSVDLEFAVPFISIPVKKSVDAAMGLYNKGQGAVANINVGSIVLAAAVIFGAAFVIPFFTSLFFKHVLVNPTQRSNQPSETWRIMTLIDQALIENNIDTTSCMQRTMCWLAKNSRTKLNNGEASSQDKIIDGLLTNYWVNQMMDGSAMQTAIQYGLANNNCALQYRNCKITQNSLQAFATRFAKYLNINK